MSPEGVAPAILQDELEAANAADALDRGRLDREQDSARNREQLRRNPATMSCAECPFPFLVRSSTGFRGAKIRPELGELPPDSEKPITENVPYTSGSCCTIAVPRSAKSVV
jgi:hypothetical protein